MKSLIGVLSLLLMIACGQSSDNTATSPDTVTDTVAVEAADQGVWKVVPISDEFGDPTDKFAITATFEGTFDNSATTNSPLTVKIVRMLDEKGEITLYSQFFEYGQPPAADASDIGRLNVKLADGTVKPINQSAYEDMLIDKSFTDNKELNRLGIDTTHNDDSDLQLYRLILSQDKPFKVSIRVKNKSYNYEVDPKGFKNLVTQSELAKK